MKVTLFLWVSVHFNHQGRVYWNVLQEFLWNICTNYLLSGLLNFICQKWEWKTMRSSLNSFNVPQYHHSIHKHFHTSEINFLPFIINNPMLFSTIQAYSFLNFSVSKSHSRAACVYYRISVVVMDLSVISSLTKASPDG